MGRRHRHHQHHNKYAADRPPMPAAQASARPQGRADNIPFIRDICPQWQFDSAKDAHDCGYYLTKCVDAVVSPHVAEDIFNNHNYPHQRDFKHKWAEKLAEEITTGVNLSFAVGPDNHPWLVNGQHTDYAIFLKGLPISCCISIYQCRDDEAIGRLYAIFDNGDQRTEQQIFAAAHIANGIIAEETNKDKKKYYENLRKWRRAVEVAMNGFRKPDKITNAEKLEWAGRGYVQEFAKWAQTIVDEGNKHNSKTTKTLTPQGIQVCMFALWSSDRDEGKRFLTQYLNGIGLEAGNPIICLRERMLERGGANTIVESQYHIGYFHKAWLLWNQMESCLTRNFRVTAFNRIPRYDKWKVVVQPKFASNKNPSQNKVESVPADCEQTVDA